MLLFRPPELRHQRMTPAVNADTVLEELAKLRQLRALGAGDLASGHARCKRLAHDRQRAPVNRPARTPASPALRFHTAGRAVLATATEMTDTGGAAPAYRPPRGVKAGREGHATLLPYVKKVMGKTRILYKLAKAAKGQPDGVVTEVMDPAVGEQTLDALIREADADEDDARQVRLVTRAS